MTKTKTKNACLLLVNIGSPASSTKTDIQTFLTNFLNDKNVINTRLPHFLQKILINKIIIPLRINKSVNLYKTLFNLTDSVSPLLSNMIKLKDKLNKALIETHDVEIAMLYSPPYLKEVLKTMQLKKYKQIVLFPMYPQYAKSTTGSAVEQFNLILDTWNFKPQIKVINTFFDHDGWINAISKSIRDNNIDDYDHILFSYHSLPNSHINEIHKERHFKNCYCETEFKEKDRMCYKAACYQNSRLLAKKLKIEEKNYTTCFQSRFGKKWLTPFTENIIKKLAIENAEKILVFSPSFTSDCLETLVEIGIEYKELFIENGGKKLDLVPCPNDSDYWVDGMIKIISEESK